MDSMRSDITRSLETYLKTMKFTLVVKYFGIKYKSDDNSNDQIQSLQKYDKTIIYLYRDLNFEMNLDLHYTNRSFYIFIPNYLGEILQQYSYSLPQKPQHSSFML